MKVLYGGMEWVACSEGMEVRVEEVMPNGLKGMEVLLLLKSVFVRDGQDYLQEKENSLRFLFHFRWNSKWCFWSLLRWVEFVAPLHSLLILLGSSLFLVFPCF